MRIVVLQWQLIQSLCALPAGATVDLVWLQNLWRPLDEDWIRRFWENDKDKDTKEGNRSIWIRNIASASMSDKRLMQEMMSEQLRFDELYQHPVRLRVSQPVWTKSALKAFKDLLISFYDPYFYSKEGYGTPNDVNGKNFDKDMFIQGFPNEGPKICPYCDNNARKLELDHFLPKDEFPVLSCHPDNLIPSCHDCNSVTQKGKKVPLALADADQAMHWFHPRRRSASGRFLIKISENRNRVLKLHLFPVQPEDKRRVFRLDRLFGLSKFWGWHVNPDIQAISHEVSVLLSQSPRPLSEQIVRQKLQDLAEVFRNKIGTLGLAIAYSNLYEFAANNNALVREILRMCNEDEGLQNDTGI